MAVEPLWDFAVRIYAHPGVEAACLELQDKWHADVPVLIYALWAGAQGRHLTHADFEIVVPKVAAWHTNTVAALRSIRRALRHRDAFGPRFENTARRIATHLEELELIAERCELEFLETQECGAPSEYGAPTIAANLVSYLDFLKVSFPRFDQGKRDLLVASVGA
ncbi:MAG: TIGR02444 family protein [Alphaproteobacteria bacterium]|nr:TIGR02444 family protein [Alphaproteobacteria bacterium]